MREEIGRKKEGKRVRIKERRERIERKKEKRIEEREGG